MRGGVRGHSPERKTFPTMRIHSQWDILRSIRVIRCIEWFHGTAEEGEETVRGSTHTWQSATMKNCHQRLSDGLFEYRIGHHSCFS